MKSCACLFLFTLVVPTHSSSRNSKRKKKEEEEERFVVGFLGLIPDGYTIFV